METGASTSTHEEGTGDQPSNKRSKKKQKQPQQPASSVPLTAGTSVLQSSVATSVSGGEEDHDLSKRMLANLIAAACGALATAVIESPVEHFRHQAQV